MRWSRWLKYSCPKKSAVGSCPHTTSGRSRRTHSTSVPRSSSESSELAVGVAQIGDALPVRSAADEASSSAARRGGQLRRRRPSGSKVPLPPSVHTTRWTAAPRLGPAGQRSPAGHVGVVGMGVDGQDHLGYVVHHRRLGSVVLVKSPTSRWKSPASSNPL